MKVSRWQKGVVEWTDATTAYLSVVFTWDMERAYERAVWHKTTGKKVRIGGPGTFVMGKDLKDVSWIEVGGDIPDAVVRHNPMATFASRGCPVNCSFCIVPAMEGRTFTLLDDFTPRPVLCDSNLSALPPDYQDFIIEQYRGAGVPLLDAQSGFEPATFTDDVYLRWREINRGPWRFAFDESAEREDVRRVMRMLREVAPRKKRVYVLIGNEPFAECMERIQDVIDWGGEPHVQPMIKLNAKYKEPWVRFGWTALQLRQVARWANRHLWKYTDFSGYNASVKSSTKTLCGMDTATL